jgi:hypothetical protein
MTKLVLSARDFVRPPSSPEVLAWFDAMFAQQFASQRRQEAPQVATVPVLLRAPERTLGARPQATPRRLMAR